MLRLFPLSLALLVCIQHCVSQQYVTARPRYENYPAAQQQRVRQQQAPETESREPEQEVEEEPDRLSTLLPNSRFDCTGKATGYYADEGLGCEVFHYCQDSARHSWVCPEGFTFHQVHLICMPPSGDDICTRSSSYHFVNDYLYRPLNEEEVRERPNVTLRYSDRYYPDTYRAGHEHESYYEQEEERQQQQRPAATVAVQRSGPTRRPHPLQPQVVFRSPEEVNIPLQQRRPQPTPLRPHPAHYYQ